MRAPHPIPYQGSKRAFAGKIVGLIPMRTARLVEPFVGSGAVTIAAAMSGMASEFLVGDSFGPLADVWRAIISGPDELSAEYRAVWEAQLGDEREHFARVRERFNRTPTPGALLYLLARCVKNAVRFNSRGEFNQSPDHRRLGMHPNKMEHSIRCVHQLLKGRATAVASDYEAVLDDVRPGDFVYMDPPYQGTSGSRDKRYFQSLDLDRFVGALDRLNSRGVRYVVSFDGRCGDKVYGKELPPSLNLRRLEIEVGRSTQATLAGRTDVTFESLYVSPALSKPNAHGRRGTSSQRAQLALLRPE